MRAKMLVFGVLELLAISVVLDLRLGFTPSSQALLSLAVELPFRLNWPRGREPIISTLLIFHLFTLSLFSSLMIRGRLILVVDKEFVYS